MLWEFSARMLWSPLALSSYPSDVDSALCLSRCEGLPLSCSLPRITHTERSCICIIDVNECWVRWSYRAWRGLEQGEQFKIECSVALFFSHMLLVLLPYFTFPLCLCLSFCMSVSSLFPSLTSRLVIAYQFSRDLGMIHYLLVCLILWKKFSWKQC